MEDNIANSHDVQIKIKGYKTEKTTEEEFTVFDIEVTSPTFTRAFVKRMKQFSQLDTVLEKNFGKDRPVLFHPMNIITQNIFGKESIIKERAVKLEKWLCDLQKMPNVFNCFHVKYFLRLYDLSDKVALVTGANTGIGKVTAQKLAEMGCHVIIASRSPEKTLPVINEIKQSCGNDKVEFLPLDLGDFQSINQCAEQFKEKGIPLHFLINNAGLAGPPSPLTKDGFETTVGVNHIGTILLTSLLFPILKRSIPSRIINVSSIGHLKVDLTQAHWGDDIRKARKEGDYADNFEAYKFSKWLMSACSIKMAEKLKGSGISVYHLHPGTVATEVWRSLPGALQWIGKKLMITPEEGALTTLYCTLAEGIELLTGKYFDDCTVTRSTTTEDELLVEKAWKQSLEWCGIYDFLE